MSRSRENGLVAEPHHGTIDAKPGIGRDSRPVYLAWQKVASGIFAGNLSISNLCPSNRIAGNGVEMGPRPEHSPHLSNS